MPLLQQVLDVAIPAITFLLMIAVGIDLTVEDFRKVQAAPRALLIGTLGQYILPVVALVMLSVLKLRPEIVGGVILLASAPGGGISNYYTYLARWNVALSVTLTAISCFLAPLSMPLLLKAFEFVLGKRIDFQVPLRALVGQLLLILLVPVAVGIVLRYSFPEQVSRHEKKLRRFSLLALAFLIGFIIYQTRQLLLTAWTSISGAAACFVFLSMATGYVVGFFFRLNRTDCQTLIIEFGVRNVAIATTAAVVILKRTEFAAFAAIYFLTEAALILIGILLLNRKKASPLAAPL